MAALLASTVSGQAQQTADPHLEALRRTPAYQHAIIRSAYNTAAWLDEKCEGTMPSLGSNLGLVSAPVVDERLQPQAGAWIEHISIEGCGRRWQLNVLVAVRAPGSVATNPLLPGTTRADPRLQKDGAGYAFLTARIDPNGCKPIYLADTAYVGPVSDKPAVAGKPAWTETWTVAQCDKRIPVAMSFIPDQTGTVISTKLARRP